VGKEWRKDLVNSPQYFHNAVFFASLFRFLSPTRQGRFEALLRDLGSAHVASASAAVEQGASESPGVFRWEGGEMAAPLSGGLTAAFSSPEYRELARASRETVHYALD
jgi:hypothetical protein